MKSDLDLRHDAGLSLSSAPTQPGLVTSWLCNTWGSADGQWTTPNVSGMHVTPDGRVITISDWEEGVREIREYGGSAAGPTTRDMPYTGLHADIVNGGRGIVADSRYVYACCRYQQQNGIQRYNLADYSLAPFEGADTDPSNHAAAWRMVDSAYAWLGEMTIDPVGNVLYVIDNQQADDSIATFAGSLVESTVIRAYSTPLLTPLGSWPCPRARSVSYDGNGGLWILQQEDAKNPRTISRYTVAGARTATLGVPLPEAISLTCDVHGDRLLVCDQSVDQNIKVFAGLGAPTPAGAIGTGGGVFAGPTTGLWGPLRFVDPRFCRLDGQGLLYVMCSPFSGWAVDGSANGADGHGRGTILECYDQTLTRLWYAFSGNYQEVAALDPVTRTDAYNWDWHYAYDPTTGTGVPVGYTLNRFDGTTDQRSGDQGDGLVSGHGYVRYIGGQRFVVRVSGSFGPLGIWRTTPGTEVLTQCVAFHPQTPTYASPAIPAGLGEVIWRDGSGDAQSAGDPYPGPAWSTPAKVGNVAYPLEWDVDAAGDVWQVIPGSIRRFGFLGMDGQNNPVYSYANLTTYGYPTLGSDSWSSIARVVYDSASDTLYCTGFTSRYPAPPKDENSKFAGRVLAKYTSWSTGPVQAWSTYLASYTDAQGDDSHKSIALAWANQLLFVGFFTSTASPQNSDIYVYDTATGTQQTIISPSAQPAIGSRSGNIDITNGVSATYIDGTYHVLCEDDGWAKTIVYRLTPA